VNVRDAVEGYRRALLGYVVRSGLSGQRSSSDQQVKMKEIDILKAKMR
jgi:hypothetical protein